MKKLIYAFGVFALIFTSCSSDDDQNIARVVLPIKTVQTFDDGSKLTMNFKYNNTKLLQMYGNGFKANVKYSGKLIESIKYYSGSVLTQEDLYSYDVNQRLAKFVRNEYGNKSLEYVGELRYKYNNDGTVSYSKYNQYGSNDQLSLTSTGIITLNYLTEVLLVEDSSEGSFEYTYDDKNSYTLNILGINKTFLNDSYPEFGYHNILKVKANNIEISNYYTYNSNNYPSSKVTNDGYETINTEYFYNK